MLTHYNHFVITFETHHCHFITILQNLLMTHVLKHIKIDYSQLIKKILLSAGNTQKDHKYFYLVLEIWYLVYFYD